jgi:hypothetical protein
MALTIRQVRHFIATAETGRADENKRYLINVLK